MARGLQTDRDECGETWEEITFSHNLLLPTILRETRKISELISESDNIETSEVFDLGGHRDSDENHKNRDPS